MKAFYGGGADLGHVGLLSNASVTDEHILKFI